MNTVMFDLDGTLLPMDQEVFIKAYMKRLAEKFSGGDCDAQKMVKAVWAGTEAMVQNDGSVRNEQRFWNVFAGILGEQVRELEPEFEKFYQNEFNLLQEHTSQNPAAAESVALLKQKGYTLIAATNPLFPPVATRARLTWAGVDPEDFALITTYDICSYCKPNPDYYREILAVTGKKPEDCMMVGNDVQEDMVAASIGIDTFLITDCIINSKNADINLYKHGTFTEFLEFVKKLPAAE